MSRAPWHLASIKRALADGEMRQIDLSKALDLKPSTLMGAVGPALRSGEILRRDEGRNKVFYRLAEGVVVPQPQPFDARIYDTGDIDFFGLIEVPKGGRRMTAAMFQQLLEMVEAA